MLNKYFIIPYFKMYYTTYGFISIFGYLHRKAKTYYLAFRSIIVPRELDYYYSDISKLCINEIQVKLRMKFVIHPFII